MDYTAIKDALLAERLEALGQSAYLQTDQDALAESQRRGESRIGGVEEGDTLSVEMSVLQQLSDGQRERIIAIDNALQRIADGTYGQCEGCDATIPFERLEARPRATMCAPCASRKR